MLAYPASEMGCGHGLGKRAGKKTIKHKQRNPFPCSYRYCMTCGQMSHTETEDPSVVIMEAFLKATGIPIHRVVTLNWVTLNCSVLSHTVPNCGEMGLLFLPLAAFFIVPSLVMEYCCGLPADRHIITVNKDAGDSQCTKDVSGPVCGSLDGASNLLNQFGDNVTISIEDDFKLRSIFHVTNTSNIEIIGKSGSGINSIQCEGIAGFIVDSVYNFSFVDLAVENCTVMDYAQNGFSMLIKDSSQVFLKGVQFLNSKKSALVLTNNREQVRLEGSYFENHYKPCPSEKISNTSHPGAVSILQNVEDESQAVHYTIVGTLFNRSYITDQKQFHL